jgi:transcriptional regulator with XRE-family HTH domain
MIRALRKARGITSDALARGAGLSRTTVSHIENNRPIQHDFTTIECVLDYLERFAPVPAMARQAILSHFNYREVPDLPGPADVAHAVESWRDPFHAAPHPAYLVCCANRIHDYNELAVHMLGAPRETLLARQLTVFDLAFDPHIRNGIEIVDEEIFLRQMVQVLKSAAVRMLDCDWCREHLNEALARHPKLAALWASIGADELIQVGVRTMGPLTVRHPAGWELRFTVLATDLVTDPRFRAVQYVPMDEATAGVCFNLCRRASGSD